jgi:hypothetical protein
MWIRLSLVCLFVCVAMSFAHATSVVANLGLKRIILAADTRGGRLELGDSPFSHNFHDDVCKIIPLGHTAVAVSGNQIYKRNVVTDPVPDWNALTDAEAAHAAYGDDLHEMAKDWARRSAAQYAVFYAVAPLRVKELASVNRENVLIDAFVVGWQGQVPTLYWEKVYLDENLPAHIYTSEQLLPYRELPYTTNGTTQALFEGDSSRVEETAAQWRLTATRISAKELDWRWVEFLIRLTGSYDEGVGHDVNVIQIPVGGHAEWLQNCTCGD